MRKKRCFRCGKVKSIDKFYAQKGMNDGHLGKCKGCTKKDSSRRYHDPKKHEEIRIYERKRFQNPQRKKKLLEYQRKRRSIHPRKDATRRKTTRAIKSGKIQRKPCEVCGLKSEAHHPDYRSPFKIIWLCRKHHLEKHHGSKSIL